MIHYIDNEPITLEDLNKVIKEDLQIGLSENSINRINKCREYLDQKIDKSEKPIYGINTGFGSLHNKEISKKELEKLQENLVRSHACGAGDELPDEIVQIMLYLKVRSLAYGYSGTQLETVERLILLYNQKAYPIVYEFGSLGASGDLAPLAHLSLPLIGEGMMNFQNQKITSKELLNKLDLSPIHLKAKEGLALLNGTQMMGAYGVWCTWQAGRIINLANKIGALSLDAFNCSTEPFLPQIHKIRPQKGQIFVAEEIMKLLNESEIVAQDKDQIQDPYSFRCIPQVHGASLDAINYTKDVVLAEINSVTDNPNIFIEQDEIISGGNFHGQALALALDFLCIALAELGNISERRTYQLLSGKRGLDEYLVAEPGLNSGLMIPQYTAASIVSKNKELCTPSSVDSIVSSNGQEDHVSMGANAATKTYKVVRNVYSILAIELITAAQALSFRRPLKSSPELEKFVSNFREHVPFINNDRIFHDDIVKSENFIKKVDIA